MYAGVLVVVVTKATETMFDSLEKGCGGSQRRHLCSEEGDDGGGLGATRESRTRDTEGKENAEDGGRRGKRRG